MMRKYFSIIIVLALFTIIGCKQDANYYLESIDSKAFKTAMDNDKDYLLLDVRTPEEYNEGKLANSVNIDYHADDFKEQIAKLDKNKTCYIYCRSGNRSHKAAVMMHDMKFKKVIDMNDGIIGWKENGYPVE